MTDPHPAGLDPAHILAICAHATGGRPGLAVSTQDGVCVCLPSRHAARNAAAALTRVGYHVTADSGPRGREVTVTGWNPAGLDSRLTAMRAVLHQLADNPSVTARAVIARFRGLPDTSQSPRAGLAILDQARTDLCSWVSARSDIHAPRPPAVLPPDVGIALRLGTAEVLEQAIDDLIERHLRVAGHALALFSSLREQMDSNRAQETAIRWAGITFHLSGTVAQDSTSLIQRALRFPSTYEASVTQPGSRPRTRPAKHAVLEFPGKSTAGTTALRAPNAAPPARPRSRQSRRGRPGLRS